MKQRFDAARRLLLALVCNVGVYVVAVFLVHGFLNIDPLVWSRPWYKEMLEVMNQSVIMPWGMALCLLGLRRREELGEQKIRMDQVILLLLLGWLIVPFAMRFGVTDRNMGSWMNFVIAYFGIYMQTAQTDEREQGSLMDAVSGLFALISLTVGGVLLYCAATVQTFGQEITEFGVGIYQQASLCFGMHYNLTGMFSVCCVMMSLLGVFRRKNPVLRMMHGIAAAMMTLVVILTQSRTSRYSLLLAYAVGIYGLISCSDWKARKIVRHAAGVLAAVLVIVGGYAGAETITRAALTHYAMHEAGVKQQSVLSLEISAAVAEEEENAQPQIKIKESRGIGDATFTGRTAIWNKLFRIWEEEPLHCLIGLGAGNAASRVAVGWASMATHNTYLQFMADYGVLGFALLAAFLGYAFVYALRAFYVRGSIGAENRVLAMMVVAGLTTGLMESEPLYSLTAVNVVLLFSLGVLVSRGR